MQDLIRMLEIQSVLFIYLLIGMLASKLHILDKAAQSGLSGLIVNFTLPFMIFSSFSQPMTVAMLRSATLVLFISIAVCFFSMMIGKVAYKKYPKQDKMIMEYATLVNNCGFAGLPFVESALGMEALFYASIFVIPHRVFMWSAGVAMFSGASGKTDWKKVAFNPGIIAVVLGLVRAFVSLPIPSILDTAIRNVGSCTSSMSMVLIGAILADVKFREVFEKGVFYFTFLRLIAIPGALLLILWACGLDALLIATCVFLTGMPAGTSTAIMAQKYNYNFEFASKCVFVSTLLSLISVPILTFMMQLFGIT